MKNLKEQIKSLLKENKLVELEELLSSYSEAEISDPLITASFDTYHIATYSVACMLLMKKQTAEMHWLAAEILIHPLCHLEGAYSAAMYHVRKAIELDPTDLGLKEVLIFLHGVPDRVVSKEEAISIAYELLEKEPANRCAHDLLEWHKVKSSNQK
jgi:hypothetical protein